MGDLVLNARNRYVHSGLYSGKEEYMDQYINWAQKYAEQALYLLLRLHNDQKYWKSEEDIDIFFDNYTKSPEFFRITNVIRTARRYKK